MAREAEIMPFGQCHNAVSDFCLPRQQIANLSKPACWMLCAPQPPLASLLVSLKFASGRMLDARLASCGIVG